MRLQRGCKRRIRRLNSLEEEIEDLLLFDAVHEMTLIVLKYLLWL
jgi:hypothetical protein